MIFSLSSFIYAFASGIILSIVFLFLLNTKTLYSVIYPRILIVFSILIIIRFLIPGELFFAKTISTTFIIPEIYEFLRKDILWGFNTIGLFLFIWFFGAIVFFMITVYQVNKSKKALELIKESSNLTVLSKESEWNETKKDIKIYNSQYVTSPFSAGVKNPAIFIPKKIYKEENLHWILHHESTHIKNKDLWKNIGFRFIMILLWWFIPIYIFRKLFTLLQEIKVDQKVLEGKNEIEGIKYARFLMEEIENQNTIINQSIDLTAFSTFGGWMMGKRLSYILDKKRRSCFNIIFCLLMGIMMILSFCFVIEPDYTNSEYTQEQFKGTYGQDDFSYAEILNDGTVNCYLKNGETINYPSKQLVSYIFPELKILEREIK